MERSLASLRIRSGLLTAMGFLVLVSVVLLVSALVPVVGNFVSAATFFSSPFAWLLLVLKGPLVNRTLMSIAVVAPYPVLGLYIGYRWPIETAVKLRTLGQIVLRFGIVIVVLDSIGLCLALYALGHDS